MPSPTDPRPSPPSASARANRLMLLAVTGGFTLSQAWRTIAAIMALDLYGVRRTVLAA